MGNVLGAFQVLQGVNHQNLVIEKGKVPNRYIEAATADNTRKAYRSDIRHFERWGGLLPANTESILQYLHDHASILNPRTLERRLIALRHWHEYQNFPDPTANPIVTKTIKGIKNIHGKPKQKAPALRLEDLTKMVKYLTSQGMSTTKGTEGTQNSATKRDTTEAIALTVHRNNALLQVGFFGAFRRSELVSIQYEHLKEVPEGFEILIPRSKTDQQGEGSICALPYGQEILCPATALKKWLALSQIKSGPIFRGINQWQQLEPNALSPRSLNNIIKSIAKSCHLSNAAKFSGHSLRRGLATSASQKGASMLSIMRHGRWRHQGTVMEYIEEGQRFCENVAGVLLSNK